MLGSAGPVEPGDVLVTTTVGVRIWRDGADLGVAAFGDKREYDLLIMEADGSDRTRLADADGHLGFIPAWSPDGTSIAFENWSSSGTPGLLAIDVESSELRDLTDRPATWPSWSS